MTRDNATGAKEQTNEWTERDSRSAACCSRAKHVSLSPAAFFKPSWTNVANAFSEDCHVARRVRDRRESDVSSRCAAKYRGQRTKLTSISSETPSSSCSICCISTRTLCFKSWYALILAVLFSELHHIYVCLSASSVRKKSNLSQRIGGKKKKTTARSLTFRSGILPTREIHHFCNSAPLE